MPPTTENIPEKPPFDVYGMMLILCFLFTTGATLLLNDELDKHWDFWAKKEAPPKKALNITQINKDPAKFGDLVEVRDVDLEEWKITATSVAGGKLPEFPEKDFKWPDGYDPLAYPVTPGADNLDTGKLPEAQRAALMKGRDYGEGGTPAPEKKPDGAAPAPKADAPAGEAPKADAPKADAPKADAPKADK